MFCSHFKGLESNSFAASQWSHGGTCHRLKVVRLGRRPKVMAALPGWRGWRYRDFAARFAWWHGPLPFDDRRPLYYGWKRLLPVSLNSKSMMDFSKMPWEAAWVCSCMLVSCNRTNDERLLLSQKTHTHHHTAWLALFCCSTCSTCSQTSLLNAAWYSNRFGFEFGFEFGFFLVNLWNIKPQSPWGVAVSSAFISTEDTGGVGSYRVFCRRCSCHLLRPLCRWISFRPLNIFKFWLSLWVYLRFNFFFSF